MTLKSLTDRVNSGSFRVWFGYISGSIAWMAGGLILLEQPLTGRVIARTAGMWIVAAMLNFIAVRSALARSQSDDSLDR